MAGDFTNGDQMADITIRMKDGTVREFKHEGRAGGSYTKRMEFQGAFAIVVDEWGKRTSIPASDIAEITEIQQRGW